MAVTIPTYAHTMGNAIPGQLLGTNEHVVLTRFADVDIAFGSPVFGKAADGEFVVVADGSLNLDFLGIAAFNQTTAGCYQAGEAVSVVNKGMVYVKVSKAVKANKPVFTGKDGTFHDAVGSSDAKQVNAIYLEDGQIGDIVPILVG